MLGMSSVGFADDPLVWHRYLADPDGLEYNGQLYVYCSNDDDNSTNGGYAMHSIVCISTDDLKNWADQGVVLGVPDDASWASYSWAPRGLSQRPFLPVFWKQRRRDTPRDQFCERPGFADPNADIYFACRADQRHVRLAQFNQRADYLASAYPARRTQQSHSPSR